MKNIMKLVFVLLASLSVVSANAGTLEVTGNAKFTYDISSSDSAAAANESGKGLGVTNEISFGASGELENGWTWTYNMALDPAGASTAAGGNAVNDDTGLSLTTPYGTVAANISQGSLNKQLTFSAAAYKAGVDLGYGAIIDPVGLGDYNNLQYHTPAGLIPFGTVFKVGYSPSSDIEGSASDNNQGAAASLASNTASTDFTGYTIGTSSFSPSAVKGITEYSIETKPIDGLTVSGSYVDIDSSIGKSTDHSQYEAGAVTVKYAYGPVTLGYGRNAITPHTASAAADSYWANVVQNRDYSIGYAVNENLTVSYEQSSSEAHLKKRNVTNTVTKKTVKQEVDTIQAAYTMGGMTLALSQSNIDGDGYTANEGTSRVDVKETILAVTMAF
jgi:hypothetical protein